MDIAIIKHFRNLTFWQIISKLIGIFYFSLLTIKLGPYDYGILALVLAIYETASIGFIGINNGLQRYIAEKHQKAVLKTCLKLSFFLSLIIAIGLFVFRSNLSGMMLQNLNWLIVLLCILLLISSIKEVLANMLIGTKNIKYYISVDATFTIIKFIGAYVFLCLSFGVSGVLISLALANALSCLLAILFTRKIKFSEEPFPIKKLLSYTSKFIPIVLVYQFQPQVFIFFLTRFIGVLEVGYYKFLLNLISILIIMTPQTLAMLTFPYMTELLHKGNKEELQNLFNSSFKVALYFSLGAAIIFYLVIGFLIKYFFAKYTPVLPFIPLFLVYGVIYSVDFVTNNLIKATDSLNYYFVLSFAVLVGSIVVTPYLIKIMGLSGAIIANLLVVSIIALFSIVKVIRKLDIKLYLIPSRQDYELLKRLFKGFFTRSN